MKFSIITVCYNSEKTIRRTFESVLNQNFTDYEYIVVDGASKDNTLDIIKEYEAKFNGRMRYISEPDSGIYDAMNKGICMAKGEFVNMMNSDDQLAPDALMHVANKMADFPEADIFNGLQSKIDENGNELYVVRHSHLLLPQGLDIRHQSAFIRRSLHDSIGLYDGETYSLSADYDFFLKAYKANSSFVPVDHILSIFSCTGASAKRASRSALEVLNIRKKQGCISTMKHFVSWLKIYAKHIADMAGA